ncbi:MAG: DNRLRE domain-containing protein [Caldithrix sp.]|nr:DNRLRE domain-containing protein [Caldithrix sp.]
MSYKKLFLLIFMSTVIWSCQQSDSIKNPVDLDLNDLYGKYVDTTFVATQDTFLVDNRLDTGNSRKILVGDYQNFQADFLLKFTALPDADEQIDSAYINLYPAGIFGNNPQNVTLNVYEVDQAWEEDANAQDRWHSYSPTTLVQSLDISVNDSDAVSIPLQLPVLNKWIDSEENNNGLLFQFAADAGFIYEFHSSEGVDAEKWPRLTYRITGDTVVTKDSTNIAVDASILDYNGQGSANIFDQALANHHLLLSSGIASRLFLRFDQIHSLPSNIILEEANLEIPVVDRDIITDVPGNPLDNDNHAESFYMRIVEETNEDLTRIELDSSFTSSLNYSIAMGQIDGKITLPSKTYRKNFAEYYLQAFLDGQQTIDGFYLHYQYENQDISVKRLAGMDSVKLNIKYFKINNTRY